MIPRQVIEEILARTDIHPLISRYTTLQRAGSNYKGLCPFHNEKTPSFVVYPADNSFYCFGCGVGGNAISFVKKAENLDYSEAARLLAKNAGITIPEEADNRGYLPKVNRQRIYEINRDAAKYFHACLYADDPSAKQAYEYLHGKRALSDATIKHFGLGFAPRAYGALYRHLTSKGYSADELIYAGLCGKDQQTGRMYDFFYNRVMFPIIDVSGNVLAFGGRVMDNSTPKYRNTGDTYVYNKKRVLFGLNFAKDASQEELILCEGYMDVIALQSAGFQNAVATCGTAITPEQARLMKRYTPRVLISYDMDKAGRNATEKAMKLLEEAGIEVKILKMDRDDVKDPDEYIRRYGAREFRRVLEIGKTKFDYNLERIFSKYDIRIPQYKIDATKEICNMIADVSSAAEREIYVNAVSKKLDIKADVLKADVERYRKKKVTEYRKKAETTAKQSSLGFSDKVNTDYVRMPAVARCEEAVLGLMLLYPNYVDMVKAGKVDLNDSHFLTAFNRKVFLSLIQDDKDEDLYADLTAEESGRITKMKLDRMELSSNGEDVFMECIKKLKDSVNKQEQKTEEATLDALNDILARKRNQ